MTEEEQNFIKGYYNFDLDFALFLLVQEIKGTQFKLNCLSCNKELSKVQIQSNIKHSTGFYCSKLCNPNYKNIDYAKRQEKIENTNLERYGVKNVSCSLDVKHKISIKIKQSSENALQKRKRTNLKNCDDFC